mgnify:FL=1
MFAQVKKWGNSQGIRISKDILKSAGIHTNDILNIELIDGDIVLRKTFKHKTLEERTEELGKGIGPYDEFEGNEPVGREEWEKI